MKSNLDKYCIYGIVEWEIYNSKIEGSILFLGDFDVIIESNHNIILRNDSNTSTLWTHVDIL